MVCTVHSQLCWMLFFPRGYKSLISLHNSISFFKFRSTYIVNSIFVLSTLLFTAFTDPVTLQNNLLLSMSDISHSVITAMVWARVGAGMRLHVDSWWVVLKTVLPWKFLIMLLSLPPPRPPLCCYNWPYDNKWIWHKREERQSKWNRIVWISRLVGFYPMTLWKSIMH